MRKKIFKNIFKKGVIFLLLFVFLFPFNVFSIERDNIEENYYVPGEIIVKYKDSIIEGKRTSSVSSVDNKNDIQKKEKVFNSPNKEAKTRTADIESKKNRPSLDSVYKLTFPKDADLEKIIREYKEDPNIEYAHLNYLATLQTTTPNDPGFASQWGLKKIEATEAWNIDTGSEDLIVAVIDTGIDYNHPDLAENMWDGTDCLDVNGDYLGECIHGYDFYGEDGEDEDNDPIDGHGHGTHVSGIISAVTDNNLGVAGVSWNSKLMAIKMFSDSGVGTGDTTVAANAIYYAVQNGAKIISNSWTYLGPENSAVPLEKITLVKDAIDYANSKGCLVIFAAGNENSSDPYQPAAYAGTLAVAATDQNDGRALYSPTQGSNYGEWVDVSAPGVDILSTYLEDGYAEASGTSMAAPFVSGLAAIIWSYDPTLTRIEVWDIIVNTADDIGDPDLGSGRINAFRALDSINFPRLEVLDFSESLPDSNAGYDYGEIEITITEENYKEGKDVEISFEIKQIKTEDVLFSEIKKEVGFVTGGETTLVTFNLGVVTTAGNYDAVVTVSASNMIGDFTTNVNFSVFSTTAAYFNVTSIDSPLNYVPIFSIESATDVFGNFLDGFYDITLFVTDSIDNITYNTTETVTFVSGFLDYEPLNVTSLEEEGLYTMKITVDGIEVEDVFEVSSLSVTNVLINEEDQDLMQGDSLQLTFTITPERASDKNVLWSVDNEEVVTITEDGLLTVLELEGTATVTATSVNGLTDSIIITAVPKTYSINIREQNSLGGVSVQIYTDSAKTETLENATETNQEGIVSKEMETGDYWFTGTKSGYNNYSGSFAVTDSAKTVGFTMTLTPAPPSGGGSSSSSSPPPPPLLLQKKQ